MFENAFSSKFNQHGLTFRQNIRKLKTLKGSSRNSKFNSKPYLRLGLETFKVTRLLA